VLVIMEASSEPLCDAPLSQMMGCAVAQSIAVCKPRNLCHLSSYLGSLRVHCASGICFTLQDICCLISKHITATSLCNLGGGRCRIYVLRSASNRQLSIFNLHTHSREWPVLYVLWRETFRFSRPGRHVPSVGSELRAHALTAPPQEVSNECDPRGTGSCR